VHYDLSSWLIASLIFGYLRSAS